VQDTSTLFPASMSIYITYNFCRPAAQHEYASRLFSALVLKSMIQHEHASRLFPALVLKSMKRHEHASRLFSGLVLKSMIHICLYRKLSPDCTLTQLCLPLQTENVEHVRAPLGPIKRDAKVDGQEQEDQLQRHECARKGIGVRLWLTVCQVIRVIVVWLVAHCQACSKCLQESHYCRPLDLQAPVHRMISCSTINLDCPLNASLPSACAFTSLL